MTRPDAEVVAAFEERAAVRQYLNRMTRSEAEEAAASEFVGRERLVVDRHLAAIRAARGAKQASLF